MPQGFEGFCPQSIGDQMITLVGPDSPDNTVGRRSARQIYQEHINLSTMVYQQLVGAGIPPEDAAYVLPRGIEQVATPDTAVPVDNPVTRDPRYLPTETRQAYEAYTTSGGKMPFEAWLSIYANR